MHIKPIKDAVNIKLTTNLLHYLRTAKGGIKLHTSSYDELVIPDVVNITEAKLHDRYGLKQLIFPKGTIIVEDRGYFDFSLMLNRILAENVFVTRKKSNTKYESIEELDLPEGKHEHILKDEIIGPKQMKVELLPINFV